MPEIDTAWEKLRSTYIPKYVAMARKNNCTDIQLFSQSNYLKAISPDHDGMCYALSLSWIRAVKDPNSSVINLIYNAHSEAAKVLRGNGVGAFFKKLDRQQSYWASDYQTDDALSVVGIKRVYSNKKFDASFKRFTKVAEEVTNNAGCYFLIKSPNHCMAASNIKNTYQFFDPNLGSVTFTSVKDFVTFFADWFSQSAIQNNYKGSQGGLASAGPAKNLVLKLDAFS